MTEPADQSSDLDALTREAIAWVARLLSGEATTSDVEELARWRRQSAAHEAAFSRAVRLWRGFETVGASLPAQVDWQRADRTFTRRALIGGTGVAIAAGAAGVMIVRPPFDLWPSLRELSANYRTGKGEQKQVSLGADISLHLSTLTSIAVLSMPGQPRIELISGEAMIDAGLAAQKPLVVVAGTGRILAKQAQFDVRCFNGEVSIACAKGALEVNQRQQAAQLTAGQQISYSRAGLGRLIAADVAQVTSWQSGLLIFRDKTLADVVDEINRYRPGRIIITDSELGSRLVNATFHLGQLDNVIVQARQLFGARVTELPGGIVLLG